MKRIIACVAALSILMLSFSSCKTQKPKIEDYQWKMRTVMHADDDTLVIDAVNEEDIAHPEAKVIDMTLVAQDGKITIADDTNNKTYEGSYAVDGKTPEGTDYTVQISGESGYATVAMTTYLDGNEEPTLPINLGKYSIYFYAE